MGLAMGLGFGLGFGSRSSLPGNPLLYIKDGTTDSVGLSTRLLDSKATGSYEVEQGHSWKGNGTAYGKLIDPSGADASVTLSTGDSLKATIVMNNTSVVSTIFGGTSTAEAIIRVTSLARLEIVIEGSFYQVPDILLVVDTQYELILTIASGEITTTLTDQTTGAVQVGVVSVSSSNLIIRAIGGTTGVATHRFNGNVWDVVFSDSTGVVFSNFLAQDNLTGLMQSQVGPNVQFVNGTYPIVEKSALYGHTWENYSEYDGEIEEGSAKFGKVPQSPTVPSQDIFGNTLTNPGTPQRNAKVYGFTGDWNGSAYLSAPHLTGSETVVESTGTSTVTISAGHIDFTAGICPYLELSDGTVYICESSPTSLQDIVYDRVGGNHATLVGATLPFFTTQVEGSLLLGGGFEIVDDYYVPNGANQGLLTQNPGVFTKESPVLIEMLPNVELSEADNVDEVWTDASTGNVKQATPTDALSLMGDNSWGGGDGNKSEIAVYNPTPDTETNTKIDEYFTKRYPV